MKISRLCRMVCLVIGISNIQVTLPEQASKDSLEQRMLTLIEKIEKGEVTFKVNPGINFNIDDLRSLFTGLSKINFGNTWERDPETGRWIRREGLGEKMGEFISDALVPLKDSFRNVVNGFANDLTAWKANLYRPATYEERLVQLRKMAYYGVLFATIPTVGILMKKGAEVALDILKYKLTTPPKPIILLAGSKYGRTDRLKRWYAGYKTPPMIFDASVKERLEEIEEKTKNINAHIYNGEKITYDNLLLYGKPGTGKTLFAQILADKTNMDFLPVTAASLLQSGVEGIKYFDELVIMANKSKYGVIIFVDEADALFVDRDKLSPDSDHYKVLNHILAATGSGSNKFMLIAATNHAYVMDPAMGRRFQDRILMPLPDENTRKELLNIYTHEQLFNAKTRKDKFVSAARAIVTNKKIDEIAKATAGLSHAEIKDMITIMGKKANATKNGIITQRNVDSAVAEAIEKMKALERDRLELEKKEARRTQLHIQPPVVREDIVAVAA